MMGHKRRIRRKWFHPLHPGWCLLAKRQQARLRGVTYTARMSPLVFVGDFEFASQWLLAIGFAEKSCAETQDVCYTYFAVSFDPSIRTQLLLSRGSKGLFLR